MMCINRRYQHYKIPSKTFQAKFNPVTVTNVISTYIRFSTNLDLLLRILEMERKLLSTTNDNLLNNS